MKAHKLSWMLLGQRRITAIERRLLDLETAKRAPLDSHARSDPQSLQPGHDAACLLDRHHLAKDCLFKVGPWVAH